MKLKLILLAAIALALSGGPVAQKITITAGTPVHVSATSATAEGFFVQGLNATGLIEICFTAIGTTPAAHCGTAGQLYARLGSSTDGSTITSAAAGWSFFLPTTIPQGGKTINPINYWIDGTHTGDTVSVVYNQR